MIKSLFLFIIAFLLGINSLAQTGEFVSEAISDCEGAINILEPGVFSVQFTGQGGLNEDIKAYPSLSSVSENNSVWFTFIAPFNGTVKLEATASVGFLQMVIFEQGLNDICDEIHKGVAEIKRFIPANTSSNIGLSNNPTANHLYSLELKEGQKISLVFNSSLKSRSKFKLAFNFDALDNGSRLKGETKVVDLRDDEFTPGLHIVVRDSKTGLPVIANLTISGMKTINALYLGSDFFFNSTKTGKITIKCDAMGYFFADRIETVIANSENEFTLWLEPLKQGKSLQIEEIEFYSGTSEFMPTSEMKLRRLKDFMALNSEVKIEIQGHVFSRDNNNSFAGQKLSEARAKRVFNYLVENGISKERMTTVGYGNTRPIFPNPKLAYEEQMNRRVEIKVL